MKEEKKLIVVCGAGASTLLGTDGEPMPLMTELNDIVHAALEKTEKGLARALNLRQGMASVDFETALGEVLAFQRTFDRTKALKRLFLDKMTVTRTQSPMRALDTQLQRAAARLSAAQRVLQEVFYSEFGGQRVDSRASGNAWTMLFNALQIEPSALLVSTTNYDPSATRGLEGLGFAIDRGFRGGASAAQVLMPEGKLSRWDAGSIAVIHLHGAVGWYRTAEDRIEDHGADHPKPISELGPPALLYPEPNKDPDRAIVKELWKEFDAALDSATHVLVLGHSLEDVHLVHRLQPHASKLAVMRMASTEDRETVERTTRKRIVGADIIWGEFSEGGFIENSESFEAWWGARSAVDQRPVTRDLPEAATSEEQP